MVIANNIKPNTNLGLIEDNYISIIKELNSIDISLEELETVKYDFKEQIASIRRYENIKTTEELLKLLEVRDVISCHNINKLYDIVSKFGEEAKQKLGNRLILQTRLLKARSPIHLKYFSDETVAKYDMDEFSLAVGVIDCISSKITKSWRKLARALKIIKENDIDKIEELDDTLVNDEQKTKKCLEIYVYEVQLQRLCNPYDTLLSALDIIGRRDVKESVEKLLCDNLKNITRVPCK